MANAYKILGQSAPATTAETDLYTCPGATEAVISSIVACNVSTAAQTFRILVTDGSTTTTSDFIYYDTPLPVNDTFVASIAITLDASDKIVVASGSTGTVIAFSLFGAEIT